MRRSIAIPILLFGCLYAYLARSALHAFPFSGDEYSYLLQAEIFARGLLRTPSPPHPEFFQLDHVVVDEWVRSKYPPGTSALLAIGVALKVPWLVTPVEGALTLYLAWVGAKKLFGEADARATVLLLGGAPLFAFHAASFFSHTATSLWLAAAFAALASWAVDRRAYRLVLVGGALGCAFLTRPVDAATFGAALVVLGSARVLGLVAIGAAPMIAANFAYQAVQFGSPFLDGYRAYDPTAKASWLLFAGTHEQTANCLDVVRALVVDWTVPGTALLAGLGYAAIGRGEPGEPAVDAATKLSRRFSVAWIALVVASLVAGLTFVDDGARPRYLSPALIPMAWLAGPGVRSAAEMLVPHLGRAGAQAAAVVVALLAPLQLQSFLAARAPNLALTEGLYQAVAASAIDRGIVIVRSPSPTYYTRNGPFFEGRVLYVSPPDALPVDAVAAAFPGQPIFEAIEGTPRDARWTLRRVA
jgi:hypothetical protein